MGNDKVSAIYCPASGPAVIRQIGQGLDDLQALVGGYIEMVTAVPGVYLVVNENGWMDGLPENQCIHVGPILGDAVFVGSPRRGYKFRSLRTDDLLQLIEAGYLRLSEISHVMVGGTEVEL